MKERPEFPHHISKGQQGHQPNISPTRQIYFLKRPGCRHCIHAHRTAFSSAGPEVVHWYGPRKTPTTNIMDKLDRGELKRQVLTVVDTSCERHIFVQPCAHSGWLKDILASGSTNLDYSDATSSGRNNLYYVHPTPPRADGISVRVFPRKTTPCQRNQRESIFKHRIPVLITVKVFGSEFGRLREQTIGKYESSAGAHASEWS